MNENEFFYAKTLQLSYKKMKWLRYQYISMFKQSSDSKKSIAMKLSWKFALNNVNERAVEIFIFIIYFIVQYNTHMTMKYANWNWYLPRRIPFTQALTQAKKSHKFPQIQSQTWSHEMSEIWNDAIESKFKQIKRICVCVFIAQQNLHKMSWHRK